MKKRSNVRVVVRPDQMEMLRLAQPTFDLVDSGTKCLVSPPCPDHPNSYGASLNWAAKKGQSRNTAVCIVCALRNGAIGLAPGKDVSDLLKIL